MRRPLTKEGTCEKLPSTNCFFNALCSFSRSYICFKKTWQPHGCTGACSALNNAMVSLVYTVQDLDSCLGNHILCPSFTTYWAPIATLLIEPIFGWPAYYAESHQKLTYGIFLVVKLNIIQLFIRFQESVQ